MKTIINQNQNQMKNLLFTLAFLISTFLSIGQFNVYYDGFIFVSPSTSIKMYLELDGVVVDSTFSSSPSGRYSGNHKIK